MKNIIITILTILLLPVAPVLAQHDDGNLAYVAGEEYKITNQNGGFTIEWNKQPAPPEQICSISEEKMIVLNPDGEDRLIISVNKDGTFEEVIDLKYQRRRADKQAEDLGEHYRATNCSFTFENGLKIIVENQLATATYRGKKLEVTGERGRWRVETDLFEAGVAYGPNYGKQTYQYLTLKEQ